MMGEYIRVGNRSLKLGTCESLFYVRFDELEAWKALGIAETMPGNLSASAYLGVGSGFRFRFPFPDEDAQGVEQIEERDHNRGILLTLPLEMAATVEHRDIWKSARSEGESYNVNICLPCPWKLNGSALKHSPLPGVFPVRLMQVRRIAETVFAPVVECLYCGGMFRIEDEGEIRMLAASAVEETVRNRILEIAGLEE